MRTRNYDWFDTKARKPVFSFQVMSGGRWCNVHADGKPCFYTTESKRDAAREAMRKMKEPAQ